MEINGINRIQLHTETLDNRVKRRDNTFAERIKEAVGDVNGKQHIADESIQAVIKGELGIHEGMQAIGKADTSLRLLNQIRSKIMTAYNEVIRMQV